MIIEKANVSNTGNNKYKISFDNLTKRITVKNISPDSIFVYFNLIGSTIPSDSDVVDYGIELIKKDELIIDNKEHFTTPLSDIYIYGNTGVANIIKEEY